ncbi:MAG: hypothetical protein JJ863_15955 [Deltaproteobacteria bacterium]|nr:hypothetical protein [Deltaproteobacteria bacterium]
MKHVSGSIVAVALLVSCADRTPPTDLDGMYEVTERLEGSCDAELTPATIGATGRFFRLEYTEGSSPVRRAQLEYFRCDTADPDSCSPTSSQDLSFGPAGSTWSGSLATASAGCVLRFRHRELYESDEGVEIIQTTYGETDESIPTEADGCEDLEALDRGRRMPCLSVVEIRAALL